MHEWKLENWKRTLEWIEEVDQGGWSRSIHALHVLEFDRKKLVCNSRDKVQAYKQMSMSETVGPACFCIDVILKSELNDKAFYISATKKIKAGLVWSHLLRRKSIFIARLLKSHSFL